MRSWPVFLILFLCCEAANADAVRLGVIAPLSGSLAAMGSSIRNGFILWKERHKDSKLELIFEDDRFEPKLSASAAQKLVSFDRVQALVTFTSGPGMAVAPIAERNRVVHFCLTVDSRLARGDYNFVHLFQSSDAAHRLLIKLEAEGIRRIGIIRFIEDAAQLSAHEIKAQAPSFHVEVVFDRSFPAGMTDFRSLIASASQQRADAVVLIALPPELELLAKQMRQLRFSPRLTSIEIFSLSPEPGLFEGLWYAQPAFPDPAYVEVFTNRFHTGIGWGHYADNVATLIEAASTGSDKSRELADRLMSLKGVPSTVGPLSAEADGIFPVPVVIAFMKNGAPQLLER